jgi:hypothetical protein
MSDEDREFLDDLELKDGGAGVIGGAGASSMSAGTQPAAKAKMMSSSPMRSRRSLSSPMTGGPAQSAPQFKLP